MQHAACGMRHAKYRSSAVERCVVTCGTEGQCKVPLLRWRFQPSRGGQGAGPSCEKTGQAEDERYPTRRGRWPAWGRGCAGEGRLLARGGPALRALPVEGRGHKTPRHVGNERICRIGLGTSTRRIDGLLGLAAGSCASIPGEPFRHGCCIQHDAPVGFEYLLWAVYLSNCAALHCRLKRYAHAIERYDELCAIESECTAGGGGAALCDVQLERATYSATCSMGSTATIASSPRRACSSLTWCPQLPRMPRPTKQACQCHSENQISRFFGKQFYRSRTTQKRHTTREPPRGGP
jgi:hypothetical protein